jgi:hypothetical protein
MPAKIPNNMWDLENTACQPHINTQIVLAAI